MEIARWKSPLYGKIKVNFDVAMRPKFAVGAVVFRNHLGRVVGAKVQKFFVAGPLEGEVSAAVMGIQEAQVYGFSGCYH